MRIHSREKIEKIKKLRKAGHSIEDIVKTIGVPKTTVWHHIKSIKLPEKYILKLRANQGGTRIKKERQLAKAEAEARDLLKGEDQDLAIMASTLYWAEGSKRRCEFINSDGNMIALYLLILRDYFKIPENSIEVVMRIFTGHDQEESLNYWVKTTNIPKKRFRIFINDGGTRGRTKYGMCRIIVRKGGYVLKLFKAIINQICKDNLI